MDPNQGDTTRFVHRLFSFPHPEQWAVAEGPSGSVIVGVPPVTEEERFVANLMIGIQDLPEGTGLDPFIAEELLKMERMLTDFRVTADEGAEVGGRPARHLSSIYRQGSFTPRLEQWILVVGSTAITIAASWDPENPSRLPEGMDALIAGFTFTDAGGPTS